MTRDEKVAAVTALHERLTNASVTLVTTNLGMTVAQSTALRRTLRAVGGEYKVAKHTLVRLALPDTRYTKLDGLLEGPRSLVFGYADPVRVTKTLVDFAEQNNKLQIDGGALEGQVLPAEQVKALAKMPPIESLRARVVRQALSPGSRVVSSATAPARRLAGAIAALVKRLEESGAPS